MTDRAPHAVQTPEAAAFLIDGSKKRLLEPLLRRPCSLAEIAEELGLSKSRMSYWIHKMISLGLVEVVRVERRGRYPTSIYRAVAESFVFPIELLPVDSDEALLDMHYGDFWPRIKRSLSRSARRYASGWQVRYVWRDHNIWVEIAPQGQTLEAARIFNRWGRLYLSAAQAQQLRQEMAALVDRYAPLSNQQTGQPHLFWLLSVEEEEP